MQLSASAIRSMLSIETFRSARSTLPMYVRWSPVAAARDSCDNPRSTRTSLMRFARSFRARNWFVGRFDVTPVVDAG